jgi:hypothetical protein
VCHAVAADKLVDEAERGVQRNRHACLYPSVTD